MGVNSKEYMNKYIRKRLKTDSEFKKRYMRHIIESNRRQRQKIRMKLLDLLGGRICKSCGFTDTRALQIDHIKGGGRKENSEMGNTTMYTYYTQHPQKAKRMLQVLCANCNWIKRWENREYPNLKS